MGSKERRERIKQATREGILNGARQIAQAEGWSGLTIRKVAELIEYSPSMVYEYFASKEAILEALLEIGFQQLTNAMQQASAAHVDPYQRLQAIALAYWRFAQANPDLYQVMHGMDGVTVNPELRNQAAWPTCLLVEQDLQSLLIDEQVTSPNLREDSEILWATLHGIVSLVLSQRLSQAEQIEARIQRTTQALLQGLLMTNS
ncbi:TetR/AcrR family transcriptional regulator [Herpetosiphon sp.]|nr:TetR/AcrR family transcriptional regulator [Herpetosiphon sp.]